MKYSFSLIIILLCSLAFLCTSSLFSAILIIDDFNQPIQYNANNLNDLGKWTDDDGTFNPGNTYDKVTNTSSRTCIKLNWTHAVDYWYSVIDDVTGMDVSSYDYISFKVISTNATGSMDFRVVLRDISNVLDGKFVYSDLGFMVQTNWIIIQILLSSFSIDLTTLKSVTFDQWQTANGKIFIDDIVIGDAIEINQIDSTNLSSGEKDETYYIGEVIRIWITETSNLIGLNGTVAITNSAGYKTNASLVDAGDGHYYFDWNTSSLSIGNYVIETTLGNDYIYDLDGYNNTGADLLIQLFEQIEPRAIWVWDQSKEILYDWGYARDDLFDFCNAPPEGIVPIDIIYMHITPNELLFSQNNIRSFVSEAHIRGKQVYYLSGGVNWGQPDDNGIGTTAIDRILNYYTNAITNERFDGVDLDIEVHNYSPPSGDWYDDPGAFKNYLNLIEYATNKFRKCKQLDPAFLFGVDIPYFYDTNPCTDQYQKVLDRVDYISLMDYKDTSNLIYRLATNELVYASSINKKVRIGVETQDLGPALNGNTFYEEGWDVMEDILSIVRNNVSVYSGYDREIIHYYDSYSRLKPYRIQVNKRKNIGSYGILQGETNKTVLSLHITSDNSLTYLTGMNIENSRNATGSDIPQIMVWKDSGSIVHDWDPGDIYIGKLIWDPTQSQWTNTRFGLTNHFLGYLGLDCILTIDVSTNAIGGREFQAKINAGDVLGSGRASGPSSLIINTGIQTIADVSTNWHVIRINEILINAAVLNSPSSDNEPFHEWVELYNTSPNVIDLSGCLLGDTYPAHHFWEIPEGTLIDGYGFKVFHGFQFNPSLDTNNGIEFLNNNAGFTERVLLIDPYSNTIDSFDYSGLNAGENDIYARKVDGFGPFYNNSTNLSYNNSWVTSKTDNPEGTTNYYSTKNRANATFFIIPNSTSNKTVVNGKLNFTIKASNYLDNQVVSNYSGFNYIAYLSINGGGIFPSITTNGFSSGIWSSDIQFTDPGTFILTAHYGGTIGNYSSITVYVPGAPPLSISELDIKQNPGFSPDYSLYLNSLAGGKKFAVHIVGVDGQPAKQDATAVYIHSELSDLTGITATLWETGTNTGVYTNAIILSTNSDDAYNIIKAEVAGERIYAISAIGTYTDSFLLANTPLGLVDIYESPSYNECIGTIHYEDDAPAENYGSVAYDSNVFYSTFNEGEGSSMRFDFNISGIEYCWIENDVGGLDVTGYTSLNFMVRRGAAAGPDDCKVQLMSMNALDWEKVLIRNYVSGNSITTVWKECNVPLSDFTVPFLGKLDNIAFVADQTPSLGSLYIDNLRFLPSRATNLIFMSNNFIRILIGTNVSIGAVLYMQLESQVINTNTIDFTPVLLYSTSDTNGLIINLYETGRNTGLYRGTAILGFNTIKSNYTLGATWGDVIYVRSYDNVNLFDKLRVISSNQRLTLKRLSPTNNAQNISLISKITATFNLPILSSTITDNFILYDSEEKLIKYQRIDILNGTNVIFVPFTPLDPNEFYTVSITSNIHDSVYGSFIRQNTNAYFKTCPGWETFHYYNTIDLNQFLSDWIPGNCIAIHTNAYELLEEDVIFPSDGPPIVSTHKLYVTWDTNQIGDTCYLYIGLIKNNNGFAKNTWYDYIALDVTRDNKGATFFIDGSFTNFFQYAFRKPEYIFKITHNAGQKYWNALETYKWNGLTWVAGPTGIAGTTNNGHTNSSVHS